ncbi:UNVERIFIED_CONTAM: hypothetical protein Sradi_4553400, partial [Sesamum radiatum]
APPESSQTIQETLEICQGASTQEINFSKFSMAFSRNTKEELRQSTVADLTIQREKNMELYLGLPSRVSRSKWDIFANIVERIWGKIMGWNEKLLSQAGKEVLIKVVVQAVCSYAMG